MSTPVSTKVEVTVHGKASMVRGKVVLTDLHFKLGPFLFYPVSESVGEELRNQIVDALAFEATTFFEDMESGADRKMTPAELEDFEARR